ncbi:MAG: autotransporter domain-containing protein [Burkholderiaceae bacterium]
MDDTQITVNRITVNAGSGGQGGGIGPYGEGGAGGAGGHASVTSTATRVNEISLSGGDAGNDVAASSIGGGAGGQASLTSAAIQVGTISLLSGDGASNVGGGVTLALTAAHVAVTGPLTLQVGAFGSDGAMSMGGDPGRIQFTAKSLSAPTLSLVTSHSIHDGYSPDLFSFVVDTLVVDQTTGLTLDGTMGQSSGGVPADVQIGTVQMRGSHDVVVTGRNGGVAEVGVLELRGSGQLQDANQALVIGALSLNGGTLNAGNWSGLIDRAYTTTAITLGAGGGTFELNTGESQTLSRTLTGSGGLSKTGAGTLTLSGTNTYTGMTTVMGGTLALGAQDLSASSGLTLYGGATFDNTSKAHSLNGKQLIVQGANGQSASYAGDLSAVGSDLHFISSLNPTQPLLQVSGDADISHSTYNIGLVGGTALAAGTTLILLEVAADKTLTAEHLGKGLGVIAVGSTVVHDITAQTDVATTPHQLRVEVKQGSAKKQAKALSEGFLGGMALALQGADQVAGAGISAAQAAVGDRASQTAVFATLGGGSMRYDTGSHLDLNSFNLLTGLALGTDLAPGRLSAGVFFEYGNGGYDTYNSFSHAAAVVGDGEMRAAGAGLLARMDFHADGPGHFYAEGSARMGRLNNEYANGDLRDAAGRSASYDSASLYSSLHLGAGYVWALSERARLDGYGQYFWTRQGGDALTLSTGEALYFDAVDSQRVRLGGRFDYALTASVHSYAGLAVEHEFDGLARATTNGVAIEAPSLEGTSGLGELGLRLTPSTGLPLTMDLGLQAYVGTRQGVSGSVKLKYDF